MSQLQAKSVSKKWWDEGIQFQCQGSGKCCTSHGEFGFVYLNRKDRQRMAKHFQLSTTAFTKQYCEQRAGVWHLKERADNPDCLFLKDKKCGVYEARPTQCRTWPFWPEVMDAKAWKKEVVAFCPGVGRGKIHSREEIEKNLQEQRQAEKDLLDGC